jgi:hypothetical protein
VVTLTILVTCDLTLVCLAWFAWVATAVHLWSCLVTPPPLLRFPRTPHGCWASVTCIIMQKNGAGLYTTVTTFWDTKKDGVCSVG